ncbi:MAG: serine/threonine protein kinase [Porticoccaceae bacterium]|jgi:serine/threonine protein kinase
MRHACPNVITLNHYVSGALDESKAEEIAEHLAVCDRCQQRSDEMASETDGLIGAVRRGAVAASKNDEPQLARLITEALNVGSSPNSNFVEGDSPDDSQLRSKPKRKDLETFIDGLRKSGLIDEKELHRLVVTSAAEDPDSFAKELVEQDALTAYQARALSRGRWKGLVLGNYVIVEKLGKGGMGQVYKARHDLMGRTVCLKVLRSVGRRSPEVVERFRREIKTHSALSHPNFVVAHDADEAEGIQFLVMEFIDGRDLSRRVKDEGPPLVKEAVKIMRQTAAALEYAHDQGVTHRDIKPHNILVAESGDDAGQVKVLDMGLARFEPLLDSPTESTTRASMTASGVIMGTVDYMSPEQALNSRNADARSDIYSLGCTMYFLLTGTTMFAGDTLMEKIIAHREQPLPKLREQVPEVPAGLDAVFQKMVARNPDDRYQTMNQLGEDLDACIAGRRPSALAAPWSDLVDRVKAKPTLASIPAAAVLLLGLAVHAAVTEPTAPAEAASVTITATDNVAITAEEVAGSATSVTDAFFSGDKRGSKAKPEDRSVSVVGRRNDLPKKVLVVLADKSYDQNELNVTLDHLKKHGFEPTVTSTRKGKLHSHYNRSEINGHVYIKQSLTDARAEDYFSIVLMTGDATWKFRGGTKTGDQLQKLLRETMRMDGLIIGMGPAHSLVTDESISGAIKYEDRNGLCIGSPKRGSGTVMKVAELKQIPKMAGQLSQLFGEVRKKLGRK